MKAAVVGAGLSGRLLAWRLAEQGAKVTLIDKHSRAHKGTGLVAAAMIAPSTEAVTTELLVKHIGERSIALWPQWLDQLVQPDQAAIYFQQRGTLVIAHKQDTADWQRFMQQSNAVLGGTAAEVLNQSQLADLEPELVPRFDCAAYYTDEGVLHNEALYTALEKWFDRSDVQWLEGHTCNQLDDSGYIVGLEKSLGQFDKVFDCRGNGARSALSGLRSVRGEVLRVYSPEVNISRPVRLMHPRYPLYIAPRPNHEYVIGATQIESDKMTPVTARSGLELLSALYSLHEGFSEAQILSLDVGCRPAFCDNLPQIKWGQRLVSLNGLYRHGYLFAPALVSDVMAKLNGQAVEFPSVMRH